MLHPIPSSDVQKTKTLIHESLPLTGTLVSGTYGAAPYAHLGAERNIKNYSHGMFQSVYDYPHLSSSANHIFDLTFGYSANSVFSASSNRVQQEKKINIYNQMAQLLAGHDINGDIKEFTWGPSGEAMRECVFINLSRLLTKDEIKKGSFELQFGTGSNVTPFGGEHATTGDDKGYQVIKRPAVTTTGLDEYYTDSPAGEYALLSGSKLKKAGLIYYQAGIVVLTASVLRHPSGSHKLLTTLYEHTANDTTSLMELSSSDHHKTAGAGLGESEFTLAVMTGSAISASCNDFRHRIRKMSFNNTTELHSTIYYIRANHNQFNYSSNPTYLSSSQIRVKTSTTEAPITYITTVGLYSADNELLAVAKLSEPLKKTPETDLTLRVRLDY
mgnify:CR=1 FL=1